MKLITYIIKLFSKRKSFSTLFSEALAEAVIEVSEEMGYHFEEQDKVKHFTEIPPHPSPLEIAEDKFGQDG